MNIRLNKNRVELLHIIQSFKFIPLKGLAEIAKARDLYRYIQNLRNVLRKLEEAELIKSFLYGNKSKAFYLTTKGRAVLSDKLNIDKKLLPIVKSNQKPTFATLYHSQQLCGIYAKLSINHTINNWVSSQNLHLKYEFRNNRYGRKVRRVLNPDACFEVGNKKYFLDYNPYDIKKEEFAIKIARYFEYFCYGDWKDRFGEFPILVFIVDKKQSEIDRWLISESVDLSRALNNRKYFENSKNVVWQAVGLLENIKNMNSSKIKLLLALKLYFEFSL